MGTFPPGEKRWSMDFYYPNPINDFWRIMGLIFLNNKDALWNANAKRFDLEAIKRLMTEKGIALNDTARKVRRLKGNASDKFLEIIEPVPLQQLLEQMPQCHAVATTGEKAASVIAQLTSTPLPKMGEKVMMHDLAIWRMPSTSRAYPMKIEQKAEYYHRMFQSLGIV
ncbi:MAG: uracil-DNA glycosylase family protein [Bacteroidales bacterium]|nr:uracil-DNA glycosylase family protein [Bacteroidales bacterium]